MSWYRFSNCGFVVMALGILLTAMGLTLVDLNADTKDARPAVGLRNNLPQVHALVNARIVTAPGLKISRGTVVVRDGMIVAVGAAVKVPADARV